MGWSSNDFALFEQTSSSSRGTTEGPSIRLSIRDQWFITKASASTRHDRLPQPSLHASSAHARRKSPSSSESHSFPGSVENAHELLFHVSEPLLSHVIFTTTLDLHIRPESSQQPKSCQCPFTTSGTSRWHDAIETTYENVECEKLKGKVSNECVCVCVRERERERETNSEANSVRRCVTGQTWFLD